MSVEKKEPLSLENLGEDLKLSKQQIAFADYYVFVAGLDGEKAVDMAGYKFSTYEKYENENLKSYYINMQKQAKARDLLSNPKVLEYIRRLRNTLEQQLIVDKLWVIKKLKSLAENGSERTQIEATKLLGQTMNMFSDTQRIEVSDDPSLILREAFRKRKEQEELNQQREKDNIIPFPEKIIN
jgi:hypothetical protein